MLLLQTVHQVQLMKKELSRRKSNAHEVSKLIQNKHALELRILEFQRLYAEERKKNMALKSQLEAKTAANGGMIVGEVGAHMMEAAKDGDEGQTNDSQATEQDSFDVSQYASDSVNDENTKRIQELELGLGSALQRANVAEKALIEVREGGSEGNDALGPS